MPSEEARYAAPSPRPSSSTAGAPLIEQNAPRAGEGELLGERREAAASEASEPLRESDADAADDALEEDPFAREPIHALAAWCTAPAHSGCTRCVAACPHGAVSLAPEGTPEIDEALCTRCGLCAGVCDAFAWERFTLTDLRARSAKEAAEEGAVFSTCSECLFPEAAPRSNVMVLPCLGSVPPEFWSALLAEGVDVRIYRDEGLCASCPCAGELGHVLFTHALASAEAWTGRRVRFEDGVPERETVLSFAASMDDDRRGMLSQLAAEGRDIALGRHRKRTAGVVADFHEQQERMRAAGRIAGGRALPSGPSLLNKRPRPRQELAIAAASALPERAGAWTRWASMSDEERCTGCGACIELCPTGARTRGADGAPAIDARRCIACGVCVVACPREACDFTEITAAAYLT